MLDAAGQLFGTQRFHEVRMEDIAAQAEVGKGTLYRYFSDKEELYLALVRRASEQLMGRLQEELTRIQGARAQLVAYVTTLVEYFDHQPHLLDLIQRAEVLRGSGPEFPWHRARTEFNQQVLAIFQEGKERGEFVIPDPELAVLMFGGALRSVIRFGKHPRPRDLADRVVAGFLHGAAVVAKAG